jgi:Peptidase inhibitor family I36
MIEGNRAGPGQTARDADLEALVRGICFKTGPPRTVGVEVEWLVHDPDRPRSPVGPDRFASALAAVRTLPLSSAVTVEPGAADAGRPGPRVRPGPVTVPSPGARARARAGRLRRTAAALPLAALAALTPAPVGASAAPPAPGACAPGALCFWDRPGFGGPRHVYELTRTGTGSCLRLPGGGAAALANRMGRPVTAYQSAECEETGEYQTYPGGGTWAPRTPYRVRAFKVWEH